MNPAELRRLADEYDARAKAAVERGNDIEALAMSRAARSARRVADALEQEEAEQPASRSGNLKPMLPAARVRISKGAARNRAPNNLQLMASAAGHTIRSLAEGVGCSHVFLLSALRGKSSIRESWAKTIQEMTRSKQYPAGFAATRRNWPRGWARE